MCLTIVKLERPINPNKENVTKPSKLEQYKKNQTQKAKHVMIPVNSTVDNEGQNSTYKTLRNPL